MAAMQSTRDAFISLGPGAAFCVAIALIARGVQDVEESLLGHPYIEALIIAILVGAGIRTAWDPSARWRPGIAFCAKPLLEFAIVLLGASISLRAVARAGPTVLLVIVSVVAMALGACYWISRRFGLSQRMAVLIACGNSICGNSAIAAVAPIIGATAREIASSMAFTAILGLVVVLTLPLLIPLAGLSTRQYGILAGLTVYAVPQVLAATVPVALASVQIGTLVKLVRVLMLGPLVILLSLGMSHSQARQLSIGATAQQTPSPRFRVSRFVPWFIIGFVALAVLRSAGVIPRPVVTRLTLLATQITIISMAALGLGVDLRAIGRTGPRVIAAVTVSVLILIGISITLIRTLPLD